MQCEPDEASSFTNPNVGPGTYASLRLKLDAWSSAVQRGQKCSSPTRRLPSRSWGPIRPRVCSWFRAPIRHECQTRHQRITYTHSPPVPYLYEKDSLYLFLHTDVYLFKIDKIKSIPLATTCLSTTTTTTIIIIIR